MKKQRNNFRYLYLVLPCMLLAAGCESEHGSEMENNEPVELQVTPTVASLTRSAIQGGVQSGAGPTVMQNVAVYAAGDDYTKAKSNNHAIYLQNDGSWSSATGNDKIFLTNKQATIYAYYPAYQSDGSTFQPINEENVTTSSTIPVSVVESASIAVADNAASEAIAAAAEEVDYMYANTVSASNQSTGKSISLTMNHALSMVSFRIYGDTYYGEGKLTQIVLKNTGGNAVLSKGATQTMNVSTGAIVQTSPTAATYTRTVSGEYKLGSTKDAAKKLSIMVLPVNAAIQDGKIEAVFTIDEATYTAAINAPTDSKADGKWKAGMNHLYTVKLSGTELSVTGVSVTAWEEVVGGSLDIK